MKKIGSVCALALLACGTPPETTATLQVKSYIETELGAMCAASSAMKAAAPEVAWNKETQATQFTKMKAEWKKSRIAYEHVEGAIAVLFPELDASTDARYEDFIETDADTDLFDGEGVTGMHAIERILYSDETSEGVIEFESALDGYVAAAFPLTDADALKVKNELMQRLVTDCEKMQADFKPLALDAATAFRGVIGSMAEQHEKVLLASTKQEESRYAKHTLADMRANLEGGRQVYSAFNTWVLSKQDGKELDQKITAGFVALDASYDEVAGDALPSVPAGFNPDSPSPQQLQADAYGRLFAKVTTESNDKLPDSLVTIMGNAADALGIPQLPE